MGWDKLTQLRGYFQTEGEVILPGIGEKVVLPERTWFRYDGEVKSLVGNLSRTEMILNGSIAHNRSLIERVLEWPVIAAQQDFFEARVRHELPVVDALSAYCFEHWVNRGNSAYVIAKKEGLSPSMSIFADGHESGELLARLSRKDLMQQFLEQEGVSLDVRKYGGEEFADLGGLLALRKAINKGIQGIEIPSFKSRPAVKKEQVRAFGME